MLIERNWLIRTSYKKRYKYTTISYYYPYTVPTSEIWSTKMKLDHTYLRTYINNYENWILMNFSVSWRACVPDTIVLFHHYWLINEIVDKDTFHLKWNWQRWNWTIYVRTYINNYGNWILMNFSVSWGACVPDTVVLFHRYWLMRLWTRILSIWNEMKSVKVCILLDLRYLI